MKISCRLRRIVLLGCLASLAAFGCTTTTLSAKARRVTLVEDDPGPGCSPLGSVTGSADPFFGGTKTDDELVAAARADAANAAARLGATHLQFTGEPTRWASQVFGGGTAFAVTALAYRCADPAEASRSPGGGGCSKDTDCKGERICEAGRCVAPSSPAPSP